MKMNTTPANAPLGDPSPKRLLQAILLAVTTFNITASHVSATETAAGASAVVISGIVTNKTTGNGLIGARVEIPVLNLSALVDSALQHNALRAWLTAESSVKKEMHSLGLFASLRLNVCSQAWA